MGFEDELQEIKEFYYISLARYGMSNQFIEDIQKKHPESSDEKPLYVGKAPPTENPRNYQFKTNIGSFKSLLGKHGKILINNCIILLVSLWELYCTKQTINKNLTNEIREVILYRNCLVHNKGIIQKVYLRESELQKYKLGEKIELSKGDFDDCLSYFEGK